MKKRYDLEERTIKFAGDVLEACGTVRKTNATLPLLDQLIRSATSIGANYAEANGASSKKDFKNKIYLCKKESKETMYWLRLLASVDEINKENYISLWKEAQELTMIFATISKNTK